MNKIDAKIWSRQDRCSHPPEKLRLAPGKIICDECGIEEEK